MSHLILLLLLPLSLFVVSVEIIHSVILRVLVGYPLDLTAFSGKQLCTIQWYSREMLYADQRRGRIAIHSNSGLHKRMKKGCAIETVWGQTVDLTYVSCIFRGRFPTPTRS
ncbi:hypothetical protein M501DRAFT_1003913 [Patellaria atrata CBS 101060]|uniref:Secreted protein n=1 Tax=Patellaria atrata CBS 101060 TaxID=1346257 RepID=A0A9P4SB06_9PEZI|nr:hypothetical protein M501DRAFT_1003913 [Patellaria atrata CBS 101060]